MSYEFKLQAYKKSDNGVYLKVFVPDENIINEINKFDHLQQILTGEINIDDGRLITAKQKKRIYLTIRDIAKELGYFESEVQQILIDNFNISQNENLKLIPMASMSVARKFIAYLLEFVLAYDIQLSDYALNRIDSLDSFLALCLKYKKCCICGKYGEVHHDDAIGRGFNRREVDDSNYKKICLCRIHHTESHTIGKISFCKKYNVHGIIFNNKINYKEI
jgi:hypothetical protein